MTAVVLRSRKADPRTRVRRRGVFISPPFHSTANPPVGLAYLVPFLRQFGIAADVRDLNIEARQILAAGAIQGIDAGAQADLARSLFPQARRSYLGEALTWAWLDEGGRAAIVERVMRHPNAVLREFWEQIGIARLVDDRVLVACMDVLRDWFEDEVCELAAGGYDWIGFSMTVGSQAAAFHAATLMREAAPSLTLLAGGPHVNARNARGLLATCPALDAVVATPAFAPLLELLSRSGGADVPVDGAWVRRGGAIVGGGAAPFPMMDELPFADWTIVDLRAYDPSFDVSSAWGAPVADRRTVPLQTSRGCSYSKCEFCHNVVDYPSYLARSPSMVVEEVRAQVETLGARSFFFTDDEFNASRRRMLELGRVFQHCGLDLRFFAWLRLDKIDENVLQELYLGGCREIFVGVEAVDDALLQLLRKGYGAELALDRLRRLRRFADEHTDFRYSFNLIFGHPLEDPDAAARTLATIQTDPDLFAGKVSALCRYHVYEGTPAFTRYGDQQAGCLDAIVPPGATVDSFRYLTPALPPESLRTWTLVAEATSVGRRSPLPDLSHASMYD